MQGKASGRSRIGREIADRLILSTKTGRMGSAFGFRNGSMMQFTMREGKIALKSESK